ncbi:hypothetical protein RHMOL_Rhmol05G0156900 [Rhododendron molle]|uniref:Uncharacterized protein n=1 Tax=Rhododendron molle TaxID=49168 RepID=A0ACC0NRP2_RHOML|nr:hypothetical protein RHMOL_Rhmol05G0156900 [Rhododendron molle]
MNHIVNRVAGAHQLKITIESMTTQLMGKPDYMVMILAEIRDFKRVQRHTPTSVADEPWFPVTFPILCSFYGFFGALPRWKISCMEKKRKPEMRRLLMR